MKKRLISVVAATLVVLSASACSAPTEQTSSSGSADTSSSQTTTNETKEHAETKESTPLDTSAAQTVQADAETVETEIVTEEAEEFVPVIDSQGELRNGSWLFQAYNSEGELKDYIYDIEAKELVEFTSESNIVDFSGFTVVYENNKNDYQVKNVKTGEVYVDTKNSEMVIKGEDTYFVDNTLLVVKAETGFDQGGKWMGVINDDGTWKYELRADYQVPYHSDFKNITWYYYGNGVICNQRDMFIMDTNIYVDKTIEMRSGFTWSFGGIIKSATASSFIYTTEDAVYKNYSSGSFGSVACYNKKDDTIIYNGVKDSEASCGTCLYGNYLGYDFADGSFVICNMETAEDITIDVSGYTFEEGETRVYNRVYSIANDTIIFECIGADDNKYLCAVNTNGERVLEPALMDDVKYFCTTNDGDFVLQTNDGTIRTVNSTTGEITDVKTDYSLIGYYKANGDATDLDVCFDELADATVVRLVEPETNTTYYKLVDLNDPANVIDPFGAL